MIIFPDIEVTLVSYLKAALVSRGETTVRVATKKKPPSETQIAEQIVIIAAYNYEVEYVTKIATATIEIFAETYARANYLGLLVESLLRGVVGNEIKKVTVRLGPIRTLTDSAEEQRNIDVELVVKATDL